SAGKTSLGDESKACGKADGDVVSLGDFGTLTYFFENPVVDGPGFDFAIFENGFINPADSFQAYLELAKVSVSNDGVHFYTFPSQCDQDTLIQVAGFGDFMDARKINNLAGKYILNFGTPFDLSVFSALSSLDCNNIRFIRIEDIAGSIDPETGSRDALQHLINDPFPTPFPGGGFDLDAVGIIHQKFPVQVQDDSYTSSANWYPNPCNGHLFYQKNKIPDQVEAWTLYGQKIPVSELANGEIQIPYHGLVLLQWNENGIVHHQWIHCL
ncbi:MAG TPA: hypothetical protein PLP34_10960, partial [Chitinophagaceae bacterium]|nr:hypothetical protein [Chitinophagaceae bacterium]